MGLCAFIVGSRLRLKGALFEREHRLQLGFEISRSKGFGSLGIVMAGQEDHLATIE
jgi:hypothetical protein